MPSSLLTTIDETSGQQNTSQGGVVANDTPDLTVPPLFGTALSAVTSDTRIGVALSGFTGSGTGTTVLSFGANVQDVFFASSNAGAPVNGVDSGLKTLDGVTIYLYTSSVNNNVVLGRAGSDSGALVFALYLDSVNASGTSVNTSGGGDVGATGAKLWVAQYLPIQHLDNPLTTAIDESVVQFLTGKLYVGANSLVNFDLTNAPSGQNVFLTVGDGSPATGESAIVITGLTASDTVNTSQAGSNPIVVGTNNQMIVPGKGLYVSYVTLGGDPDGAGPLLADSEYTIPNLSSGEASSASNIHFSTYLPSSGGGFSVVQTQPNNGPVQLLLAAYNETDNTEKGTSYFPGLTDGDETAANITSVTITRGGKAYTASSSTGGTFTLTNDNGTPGNTADDLTLANATKVQGKTITTNVTVDFSGTTARIDGLLAGDHVDYVGDSHDRIKITNDGASGATSFDIGQFSIRSGSVTAQLLPDVAFVDDEPTAGGTAQTGTVDEDTGLAGSNAGGPGDVTATLVATGSVTNIFSGGTDGVGGYSLTNDSAAIAALPTLTSEGATVAYDVTGNNLTAYVDSGSTAGALDGTDRKVFTLALSGTNNANFTFTLIDNLDHPGTDDPGVTGTQTSYEDNLGLNLGSVLQVTDRDGDKASAAANKLVITVNDDSPTATGSPVTGFVDEDALSGNPGGPGDDPGTAVSVGNVSTIFSAGADGLKNYSLSTDTSGLSTTLKSVGGTVVYDVTGNTLTAYVDSGTTAGALDGGDRQVFTFALDGSTGAYTFTLLDQLDHPLTDDPSTPLVAETSFEDNLTLNLGSVLQVTDGDGDTVRASSGQLAISVDDDSPVAFTPTSVSLDNTGSDVDTKALGTTGTIGADTPLGSVKFVDVNTADNYLYAGDGVTKLTSGGQNIVLSGFGTSTLTAKTETSLLTVFTATLNGGTDQYTIDFDRTLDDGSVPTSLLGAAPVRSGNPTYNLVNNVSGTDLDLLFSGATNGVQNTVNVSTNGAGTGNQTMNTGDMLRIDFTKDASLAGSPNGSDFVMGTHKDVNDFAFLVSQNTPSGDHSTGTVLIRIFDANNDKNFGNDTLDTITQVKYNSTVIYANGASTDLVDANGNTVHAIGVDTNSNGVIDSVVVTGLNEGKSGDGTGGDDPMITVHAATTYNRVEMTNYTGQTVGGHVLGGTDFDIAPAGVFQGTPGHSLSFSLAVQDTDFDGDASPVALIGVTMVPVPLA